MRRKCKIDYTVNIWKEGDQFISHAMPLDIMSSGDTHEKASNALDEAVNLFLQVAIEEGSLDSVLEEAGYVFLNNTWVSPTWIAFEKHFTAVGA